LLFLFACLSETEEEKAKKEEHLQLTFDLTRLILPVLLEVFSTFICDFTLIVCVFSPKKVSLPPYLDGFLVSFELQTYFG
jgi:hypothetical protein